MVLQSKKPVLQWGPSTPLGWRQGAVAACCQVLHFVFELEVLLMTSKDPTHTHTKRVRDVWGPENMYGGGQEGVGTPTVSEHRLCAAALLVLRAWGAE